MRAPLDFNDPFDCVAHEHMFDDFRPESLEYLASIHPGVSPEAITRENTERLIKAIIEHPEIIKINAEQKIQFEKFTKNLGVLALSARNDSILMWSHYASYHKGFCIGFKNKLGLDENCIMKVDYTDMRNNDYVPHFLDSQKMSNEKSYTKFLKEFIYTKYIDWGYEQEWRIIGNKRIAIYPPNSVDRIIFGVKMPFEERNTIRYMLRDRSINFFEAVKSKRHFAIEIKQID